MGRFLGCGALAFVLCAATPVCAAPPSTDAKSIPKPILMLMLYCHSAIEEMRVAYTRPGQAAASKTPVVAALMAAFEQNRGELDGVYAKAVGDGAVTPNEGKFLDLTARKDAMLWVKFAGEKCAGTLFDGGPPGDEQCLRDLNSEVFKCYQSVNERAGAYRAQQNGAASPVQR